MYYTGRLETLNMWLLWTLRPPTLNKYICKPTKFAHLSSEAKLIILLSCALAQQPKHPVDEKGREP